MSVLATLGLTSAFVLSHVMFLILRPAAMQFFWNQEGVYIRKEFNSPGFVQSLEFLKKSRNLQSNFSDLEKI